MTGLYKSVFSVAGFARIELLDYHGYFKQYVHHVRVMATGQGLDRCFACIPSAGHEPVTRVGARSRFQVRYVELRLTVLTRQRLYTRAMRAVDAVFANLWTSGTLLVDRNSCSSGAW